MGEQGVQEGAEHAPLWGSCVEYLQSGGVVSYLYHLVAVVKVQGEVQTHGPKLSDELGGYYGVAGCAIVNEQYSYIGILSRWDRAVCSAN
jgi:hypothetical protein